MAYVPIVANGTHIIGFDLYDTSFLHFWKIGKVDEYLCFQMAMNPLKEFNISVYLYKVKTTNWYDAMEKWHFLFPDIYLEQIAGYGIAFDSFSNGAVLDYVFNDSEHNYHNPGEGVLPYNLIVEGQECVPLFAHYMPFYNAFISNLSHYAPGGFMTNAVYEPHQFIRFHASGGFEIQLTKSGYMDYSKMYQSVFWSQRFSSGSKPISHIEDVKRDIAFNYKEEYFSILLSFGAAASYFSEDGSTNRFWSNCSDIENTRPFFQKWSSITRKVLNDTIFYANQEGRVTMTFNENEQVPPLNENDISTKSMFCEKGNGKCYVNVFLGYNANHNYGSNFRRKADVNINGYNVKCIFNSDGANCTEKSDKKGAIVEMNGIESGRTYQIAVLEFDRVETDPTTTTMPVLENKRSISKIGVIVGSVIGSLALVTLFTVFILNLF